MTQYADLAEPFNLQAICVGMNGPDWLFIAFEADPWSLRVNLPRANAKELASSLQDKSWAPRVRESDTPAPQGGAGQQRIGSIKLSLGWFTLPAWCARRVGADPRVTGFRTSALERPISARAHVTKDERAVVALDLAGDALATISQWPKVLEVVQSLKLLEERFDACFKAGSEISVQVDAYGLPWAQLLEYRGPARTMKLEGFGDARATAYTK